MNYSDVDLKKIVIHPYSVKDGMNITLDNKPLEFNIPRMYMPFGISGFENQQGYTNWNINFSMKGYKDEESHIKKFHAFIKDFENVVINHIVENSESIFKETKTEHEVREMWNSNLKQGGYEPNLTVKVYTVAGTEPPVARNKIYNGEQKPISNTLDVTNKYAKYSGAARIVVDRIYFFRSMIGLVWKTHQLMVWPAQKLNGFQFLD